MFRFTIRDVLWLMVVVGLGAGWWLAKAPKSVEVNPWDLIRLYEPGRDVKITIRPDVYIASSADGSKNTWKRKPSRPIVPNLYHGEIPIWLTSPTANT
jgi:hypothetical protein